MALVEDWCRACLGPVYREAGPWKWKRLDPLCYSCTFTDEVRERHGYVNRMTWKRAKQKAPRPKPGGQD